MYQILMWMIDNEFKTNKEAYELKLQPFPRLIVSWVLCYLFGNLSRQIHLDKANLMVSWFQLPKMDLVLLRNPPLLDQQSSTIPVICLQNDKYILHMRQFIIILRLCLQLAFVLIITWRLRSIKKLMSKSSSSSERINILF